MVCNEKYNLSENKRACLSENSDVKNCVIQRYTEEGVICEQCLGNYYISKRLSGENLIYECKELSAEQIALFKSQQCDESDGTFCLKCTDPDKRPLKVNNN